MYKEKLNKISENFYELPKEGKMNVPSRFFVSDKLFKLVEENAIKQTINVAQLSGIINASIAMPDIHSGYGFPIGGVAAFDIDNGIITPGGIGFDINCGVRVLTTDISLEEFSKKRKEIIHDMKRTIPSGVGRGYKGSGKISDKELNEILTKGARWAIENGMGIEEDLERCEEKGYMEEADPSTVSERAKKRGLPQAGTLGAGNHFVEIQKVEDIFDKDIAKRFGLDKKNIVIMIHCGSRGLGHQIASDYIRYFEKRFPEQIQNLPDRELVNAPIKSQEGQDYFKAMSCGVNFAFCNRQIIMHHVREVLKRFFPKKRTQLMYDVCHNIAKIEKHELSGEKRKVCVHRKGATRAFGPGRKEIPEVYRDVGQPVIIPGSMGTSSYILVGTKESEKLAFGSTAHGAGRVMSRSKAKQSWKGEDIKDQLNKQDIEVEAGSMKGLSEEAPRAYKDVDEVIEVSDSLKLARKVAKLKPLAVMKG